MDIDKSLVERLNEFDIEATALRQEFERRAAGKLLAVLENEEVSAEGYSLETFRDLIRAACAAGISEREIADDLAVMRMSVSRWRDGLTRPAPPLHRILLAWIKERLRERSAGQGALSERIEQLADRDASLPTDLLTILESSPVSTEGLSARAFSFIITLALRSGITVQHFCDLYGVTTSTIERWRTGKSTPGPLAQLHIITGLVRALRAQLSAA